MLASSISVFRKRLKTHLFSHDTTRSTCRDHAFWLCRACRTARLDTFNTTRSTRSLVCCVICIKLRYVSYSLIYWSIPLFNLFHLTEQLYLCIKEHKTTKFVQASTIACSSSTMLEKAQLDALDTSRRDEQSGIWALLDRNLKVLEICSGERRKSSCNCNACWQKLCSSNRHGCSTLPGNQKSYIEITVTGTLYSYTLEARYNAHFGSQAKWTLTTRAL